MTRLSLLTAALFFCTVGVACTTAGEIRSQNRQRLSELEVGMSRESAMETMGAFQKRTQSGSRLNNPYRTETARVDTGGTATLLWYYTDLKNDDGAITDDELTPVVLENGEVIGWGSSMVDARENEYIVRIR